VLLDKFFEVDIALFITADQVQIRCQVCDRSWQTVCTFVVRERGFAISLAKNAVSGGECAGQNQKALRRAAEDFVPNGREVRSF
jgi:hypothetical protein